MPTTEMYLLLYELDAVWQFTRNDRRTTVILRSIQPMDYHDFDDALVPGRPVVAVRLLEHGGLVAG